MSRIKVLAFTVSVDGYGAGTDQTLQKPMGVGGENLHGWMRHTQTFHRMTGQPGGSTGTDDGFAQRSFGNIGAWIMGRHMFGPVRGPWPDESWQGWWGDEPPYHVPVFVMTHHARPALSMKGDTVFHFVTAGLNEALARAREAAGSKDIRIGGGVSTVRQFLQAGLVDEMHLVVSPVALGRGENLLAGIDLGALGLKPREHVGTESALHVVFRRD